MKSQNKEIEGGNTELFQMRIFGGLNKGMNLIIIKVFISMIYPKPILWENLQDFLMNKKWAEIETERSKSRAHRQKSMLIQILKSSH